MSKEELSSVDAAWLHMEDPTNLMMISGFFQFPGPLDYDRLKATLEHRLLRFKRFRQRIVESRLPLRPPHWEFDPNFKIESHLHRIALPAPGDDKTLLELVNDLASTPLDFSKPLWQYHIIEGYEGGTLLFCRLHHCIADGIALMHVLLSMCDQDADAPWPEPEPEIRRERQGFGLGSLMQPAVNALAMTRKITGVMMSEGREILANPAHALDRAKEAASYAGSFGKLVLLPPDPKTRFKGALGVSKRTSWTGPMPLAEVKALGKAMGGTVNDVLMTIVSGALGRYMKDKGDPVADVDVRAMVPLNLRPLEDAFKLGNRFGLLILALPMGIENPLERMVVVKRRMDDLKDSPDGVVAFGILQAMGMAPSEVESLGVEFFATKATMVLTNVPGPRQKMYFAGQRLDKIMFWVPQSGRLGMGISIFSYAGEVVVGVITDTGLIPDPETIVAAIHAEFAAMKATAMQVEQNSYHGGVAVSDEAARERCAATTRSGQPCRNRPMAGSAYCHIHGRAVADSDDMALGE